MKSREECISHIFHLLFENNSWNIWMHAKCRSSLNTSKTAITGLTCTHYLHRETYCLNAMDLFTTDIRPPEAEEQKRREEKIHSTPDNNSNTELLNRKNLERLREVQIKTTSIKCFWTLSWHWRIANGSSLCLPSTPPCYPVQPSIQSDQPPRDC